MAEPSSHLRKPSGHRLAVALLLGAAAGLPGPVYAVTYRDEPIRAIEPVVETAEHVALGELLFHDPRLSRDGTIRCASCHPLSAGGTDGLPFSVGVGGALGVVNAPTVYNSGLNLAQFWDGRAWNLEEQVAGPVHNPLEMATNWAEVLPRLRADDTLRRRFERAYPAGLTADTVADAVAAFERSLTTPDSPFDRWLAGDDDALDPAAKEGYRLFKAYGCAACHQGANVGGNMFQRLGTMGDYFADRGSVTAVDHGRFNVTGNEQDRHVFKVPSLRLAALTPPYFHDASQATLADAITTMARYQLGRDIPPRDVQLLIRFLESLVGRHEALRR